eukprot:SAG31_NODE_3821_length_3852_cov_4.553424_6_plen_111_part_00
MRRGGADSAAVEAQPRVLCAGRCDAGSASALAEYIGYCSDRDRTWGAEGPKGTPVAARSIELAHHGARAHGRQQGAAQRTLRCGRQQQRYELEYARYAFPPPPAAIPAMA